MAAGYGGDAGTDAPGTVTNGDAVPGPSGADPPGAAPSRIRFPVDFPDGERVVRLDVPPAPVPDAFLAALAAHLGPEGVAVADDILDEAGRDWWPLSAVWATDGRIPARPGAVARPADTDGVAACIRLAAEHGVPLTPAAGRSGVCGGAVPVAGGVALDLTGLAGIIDVDATSLRLRVLPGTFGDDLEQQLAEHGVTLGHWPQSVAISTVGGWLACRGAGQYSTRYGKIEDMVVGLEVVDGRGRRFRTGGHPRAATGPDLTQVFVGSEGTLGVITEATLRVRPRPAGSGWAAYRFERFADGLDACRRSLRRGATPAVMRLYDQAESTRQFSGDHFDGDGCLLLVLDEGDPEAVDWTLAVVNEECRRTPGAAGRDRRLVGHWLEHRNDVSALGMVVRAGLVVDTIEVAGTWSALPRLYEDVTAAIGGVAGTLAATAHCSHAYLDGGCLYFTFAGAPGTDPSDKDRYYRSAFDAAMSATLAAGGAISHHHGIGLLRGPWLRAALGDEAFAVLADLKAVLDPAGILNPGKLGLPSPFIPEGWSWS
jgi:alkyldihydroxyacetonephosphate synthase